jgi:hypothetical protein
MIQLNAELALTAWLFAANHAPGSPLHTLANRRARVGRPRQQRLCYKPGV